MLPVVVVVVDVITVIGGRTVYTHWKPVAAAAMVVGIGPKRVYVVVIEVAGLSAVGMA